VRGALIFRLALVIAICVVGVVLVSTTSGTDSIQASVAQTPVGEVGPAAVQTPVPPAGQFEWALVGMVASGVLIFLLRPRRRVIVSTSTTDG